MIISKLKRLRFEKEEREARKLTYVTLKEETGLASATLGRLLANEPIERIDGKTLDALCKYFGCQVGDLLVYVPEGSAEKSGE